MRKIYVDGVSITLTPKQEKEIAKEKKAIERSTRSFVSVLKKFGFTTKDSIWFEHIKNHWCAEIYAHNSIWIELWMVGPGLKSSGMPGGYMYGTPKEVAEELIKALEKLNNQ